MSLTRLFASVLLVGLVACKLAGMEDSFNQSQYRESLDEKLRREMAAPLIIEGVVRDVREIGGPVASRGDSRVVTQLVRIKINVEQVVKGSLPGDELEFYYFTFSRYNKTDLGVRRYIPEVSQRRIYFLKPDHASYRSVGDVTDYTMWASGGSHAADFCAGVEAGCCLAKLLLLPSEDEVEPFVRALDKSAYIAHFVCPDTARALLDSLATHPNPAIAQEATRVITNEDDIQPNH